MATGHHEPKTADTAVIIPSYNGLKFLKGSLDALGSQTYGDFRVIVVDNGSSDGSAEFLREHDYGFPLDIIELTTNLGFAAAVNIGIDAASGARYIVLLNNDTEADPEYLKYLIAPFTEEGNASVAAVTPLMLRLSDPERIDDAGDGYNLLGWAFQRGVDHPASSARFGRRSRVFSACAGAAAYRAEALRSISYPDGVFDREHFAYLEDVDVSMRLRLAGYGIIYEPRAKVLHAGSGTSGSRYNEFKVRLAARNNIFLIYKNFPLLMILIDLPFFIAGTIVKALFFARRGFGRAYLNGLKGGISGLKNERDKRFKFTPARIPRYIVLELYLIGGTWTYIRDFVLRKMKATGAGEKSHEV